MRGPTAVLVFLSLLAAAGSEYLWAAETQSAADYPNRAITIIVPWSAGGPTDTVSRIVAGHMSATLKQRVLVENIVGAGGLNALLRAKRAAPDGYTLLTGNTGTHAAAVALFPKLAYDPRTDFEPIGVVTRAPVVILSRSDLQPRDLQEFISYVKANSQRLDEAHGGMGSIPFIACLAFNHMLAAKPRLVSYDGAAPALEALVRRRVDYMCDLIVNSADEVRAGKVKAYAIAAPERSPALPDVPTTKEAGLPEYQMSGWQAMFAPRGVPKDIVQKLNDALASALDDEAVRSRLLEMGAVIPNREQRTPQALAQLVSSEIDRWTPIIREAGFTAYN